MVRLSVAIMAVPSRLRRVAQLQHEIGECTVIVDRDRAGCWPTARRAWAAGALARADYHLVVQDDVELCGEFRDTVVAALSSLNAAHPVCLMAGHAADSAAKIAFSRGSSWITMDGGAWGPATCLPVSLIPRCLRWVVTNFDDRMPHDDLRLAIWAIVERRPVWLPIPSLVQHAPGERSTMGHGAIRGSSCFIGRGVSGRRLDWTPAETPPHVTRTLASFRGKIERYAIGAELRAALREESRIGSQRQGQEEGRARREGTREARRRIRRRR